MVLFTCIKSPYVFKKHVITYKMQKKKMETMSLFIYEVWYTGIIVLLVLLCKLQGGDLGFRLVTKTVCRDNQ